MKKYKVYVMQDGENLCTAVCTYEEAVNQGSIKNVCENTSSIFINKIDGIQYPSWAATNGVDEKRKFNVYVKQPSGGNIRVDNCTFCEADCWYDIRGMPSENAPIVIHREKGRSFYDIDSGPAKGQVELNRDPEAEIFVTWDFEDEPTSHCMTYNQETAAFEKVFQSHSEEMQHCILIRLSNPRLRNYTVPKSLKSSSNTWVRSRKILENILDTIPLPGEDHWIQTHWLPMKHQEELVKAGKKITARRLIKFVAIIFILSILAYVIF